MDRGSLAKWLLLGAGLVLFFIYGLPLITGKGSVERQPLGAEDWSAPAAERPEEKICTLKGPRFTADLSSYGASLRHLRMTDAKYSVDVDHPDTRIDLVQDILRESRKPLRTDLRLPSGDGQQVPAHDLDWKLLESTDSRCVFRYADENTEVEKTLTTTERPFEIAVAMRVRNLSKDPKKHRLAIEQTVWRTLKDQEGSLGRQSEFLTESELHTKSGHTRLTVGDFEPSDFKGEHFTSEKWYRAPGDGNWAATSSSYFSNAIIHIAGATPAAEAQHEEYWDSRFASKKDDPQHGYVYRSRLAYPEKELAPGEEAKYEALAFMGPKERQVLATVGGGVDKYQTSQLINLGWFGVIGKVLVGYVYWLHAKIGSWGWAIVFLTISVKMLLFPLTLPQIKSSFHMRRLKPQSDVINEKYKDDATQRGLAMQELWRKEGVTNPMLGCLPVVLQMPVWIALYTSLQTAVELYHTPFGPFMPDLSHPGKYFIIPAILGCSSFLQQRIMPAQGDPAQQKMMQWMMPIIFTVMMLFLPAGLGVYMITNTWLGIVQQVSVERWMKTKLGTNGPRMIEVREKKTAEKTTDDDAGGLPPALDAAISKKGKRRGGGRDAEVGNG